MKHNYRPVMDVIIFIFFPEFVREASSTISQSNQENENITTILEEWIHAKVKLENAHSTKLGQNFNKQITLMLP